MAQWLSDRRRGPAGGGGPAAAASKSSTQISFGQWRPAPAPANPTGPVAGPGLAGIPRAGGPLPAAAPAAAAAGPGDPRARRYPGPTAGAGPDSGGLSRRDRRRITHWRPRQAESCLRLTRISVQAAATDGRPGRHTQSRRPPAARPGPGGRRGRRRAGPGLRTAAPGHGGPSQLRARR
jgi:hypothetical protein